MFSMFITVCLANRFSWSCFSKPCFSLIITESTTSILRFLFYPCFRLKIDVFFSPLFQLFSVIWRLKRYKSVFFDFKLYRVGGRNKTVLKQVFSFNFRKVGFLYLKFFISRQIFLGNVISFAFYIWNTICE